MLRGIDVTGRLRIAGAPTAQIAIGRAAASQDSPTTLALLGLGGMGVLVRRRRS
ncbi:MAG: PEP-CTERM sorting domain-containing protein [Phycisphaerae bacterium]|nr:PEP-CTERM sorting domain-containing protein [Phycisphaerae bacterium]